MFGSRLFKLGRRLNPLRYRRRNGGGGGAGGYVTPGTLRNPSLAVSLGPLRSEGPRPFVNQFKLNEPWRASNTGGGYTEFEDLVAMGAITETGDVLEIPAGIDNVVSFALRDLNPNMGGGNNWRLMWDGEGDVFLSGAQDVIEDVPNQIDFRANSDGASFIAIIVAAVTSERLTNWRMVNMDDMAQYDAGDMFRMGYLEEIRNYRALGMDNWIDIVENRTVTWGQRTTLDHAFWNKQDRRLPLEVCVDICNIVGADLSLNLPYTVDDDFIDRAAQLVFDRLLPARHCWVQYGHKCWDFATPAAAFCRDQGDALFGDTDGQNFMEWYGVQTLNVGTRWRAVWGATPRLHVTGQGFQDNPGLNDTLLVAPRWLALDPANVSPHTVIDALGVHFQIDGGMAYGEMYPMIEGWRTTLPEEEVFNRLRDQELSGAWALNSEGQMPSRTVENTGARLIEHRVKANEFDLELICIDGGSHLHAGGEALGNFDHMQMLQRYHYSPQFATVAQAILTTWSNIGGNLFIWSVSCRIPEDTINVGLQRFEGDHNLIWDVVYGWNTSRPGPADRGPSAFVGAIEVATDRYPEMVAIPTASPTEATVGDNITLTVGGWLYGEGVGILMQEGVDRTSEIVDDVWAVSTPGDWTWEVNGVGPTGLVSRGITLDGTVVPAEEPAVPLTADDYWAFVTQADAPGATGSEISAGLTGRGDGAPVFAMASSGTLPQKLADGIRFFQPGRYLLADGLSIPAGDGFRLAVDFTLNAITGTQNVLGISSPSGVLLATLRTANAMAQYNAGVAINGTQQNFNSGPVAVGQRVQLVLEIDRVAQTIKHWNLASGELIEQPLVVNGPINAVRLLLGQSSNHLIHRISVMTRPTGQPWEHELEEVLADYGLTGGGSLPANLTRIRYHFDTGQSLGLGINDGANTIAEGSEIRWRAALFHESVRMLGGTYRSDAVLINQVASPLLKGYDTARDAVGDAQGYASGNIPPAFVAAIDMASRLPEGTGITYQFHGAGGQSIVALSTPGEIPYENGLYHLEQVAAVYGSEVELYCPVLNYNQGEADIQMARFVWLGYAMPYVNDMMTRIMNATGQTEPPVLYINQTGGYMNKLGPHNVVLDQIDLVRNYDGVMVMPLYATKISNADDRGVHKGTDGNLIVGYTQAWAIEEHEAGRAWNLFPPQSVPRVGNTITIPISVRSDETLITTPGKYDGYGGDPEHLGLSAIGGGSITNASITDSEIVVQVTGTITAIRFAMQTTGIDYRDFVDANGDGYSTHRGIIRTTLTRTVNAPGGRVLVLTRDVPSFEVLIG